jgi:hypothetical protein
MAHTTIANLWTPAIWIPTIDEGVRSFPSLVTSPVVQQSPLFDSLASGGGTSVNLPFFQDFTDTDDGIQVENSAPTVNNLTSGTNVAPVLNRVVSFGSEALAKAVAGADPVAAITRQIAVNRQKRAQKTLLAIIRGLFAANAAPATAAALSACRSDVSLEAGASPAAGQLIDSTKFNNAVALMGELQSGLLNGVVWMHPIIRAALLNADSNSFERLSRGDLMLETYKGIPVVVSNLLVRAGTTSGSVYDTYVIAPGAIAWGMKPQVAGIDAASLQYDADPSKNQEAIYDRTRMLIHVNGTKWTGTPSGQSATDAELRTSTNWALAFQSADRCGIVQIRTNG